MNRFGSLLYELTALGSGRSLGVQRWLRADRLVGLLKHCLRTSLTVLAVRFRL
jgi:hypothetical protein